MKSFEQAAQTVSDVKEALDRAGHLFAAARYQEAAAMLQRAITLDPRNAAAYHLLGVVAHNAGNNLAKAVELVNHALTLSPKDGQIAANLTELLRLAGRLEEAVAMGERATKLAPRSVAAHSNLGIAYYDSRRYAEAEASQKRAIAIDPTNAAALNNLGSIRRLMLDAEGAAEYYRKVQLLHPSHAESANNLGSVLTDLERLEEARAILLEVVSANPRFAEAQKNLGRVLLLLGDTAGAETALRAALQARPDFPEAHIELSALLQEKNQPDLAMDEVSKALAIAPDMPAALIQAGRCHAELGDVPNALACYEKVLEIAPENGAALLARGQMRMEAGDMEGARADFEAVHARTGALDLGPVVSLVNLDKVTPDSPLLATLERHLETAEEMSPRRRIALHYALGKAYDDLKRPDEAFSHFARGAALKRAMISYDADEHDARIDAIRAAFTAETIAAMRAAAIPTAQPVFVLGMPRSGTTLTESILSNHPEVFGAGELPDMHRIFRMTGGPAAVASLPPAELRARAYRYAETLNAHAPGKPRITDKMPSNYELLGIIHALMPNARIIHVSRHPLDTCLSQFTRQFAHSQHQSYDLTELGRFYAAYRRLMDHWRAVLPEDAVLTVRYEDLVADIETEAKRLVAHCGLAWNDACLAFHEARRRVRTASVTQVRQPIYRTSLAKWKAYEAHLGPLKAAIGPWLED